MLQCNIEELEMPKMIRKIVDYLTSPGKSMEERYLEGSWDVVELERRMKAIRNNPVSRLPVYWA